MSWIDRLRMAVGGRRREIRLEDALKHMHHCRTQGRPATVESLAGALNLSTARALQLLTELEESGLIATTGQGASLTEAGAQQALRLVRAHRLWETQLKRSGLGWLDAHEVADRREHNTSPEDSDSLEAQMGYPPLDPHGDPIPASDGPLPTDPGTPLTDWPLNRVAKIVHVEDEPRSAIAQLLADGIVPGGVLRVTARDAGVLELEIDGQTVPLTSTLAAQIAVEDLGEHEAELAHTHRLSSLQPGQSATVVRLDCEGIERWRLEDLGVLPGTAIHHELSSPLGDPTAYRVRDTLLALRKDQADRIRVTPASGPSAS